MKEKKYPTITLRLDNECKQILANIANKSKFIKMCIKNIKSLYDMLNDETLFELIREYNKFELKIIKNIEDYYEIK